MRSRCSAWACGRGAVGRRSPQRLHRAGSGRTRHAPTPYPGLRPPPSFSPAGPTGGIPRSSATGQGVVRTSPFPRVLAPEPRLRPAQEVATVAASMRRPEILAVAAAVQVIEIPGSSLGDHACAPRADRLAAGHERGEAAPFGFMVGLIFAGSPCHLRFRYLEPNVDSPCTFRNLGRETSESGVSKRHRFSTLGIPPIPSWQLAVRGSSG